MMTIYKSINGRIAPIEEITSDIWVNLTNPTIEEISYITRKFKVDIEDVTASLDNEESSRVETADNYTLILVDIPYREVRNSTEAYATTPISIILTKYGIVTTCLKETDILDQFFDGRARNIDTAKRMRLLYQILYRNATIYQNYLRAITEKRKRIEADLSSKTKTNDLILLHELESNLVYFATSLRSNGIVMNKLFQSNNIKRYQEDTELLEDAIIENKQAIEMAGIYRDILNGTRELFASVIDNNLNTVMKFMTSITFIMAIPTIISGFYGMNVNSAAIPLADSPYAFLLISIFTALICIVSIWVLKKKHFL